MSVYPDIACHIGPDVRCDVRDVPDIASGKKGVILNIGCDIGGKTPISGQKLRYRDWQERVLAQKSCDIGPDIGSDIGVFAVISDFCPDIGVDIRSDIGSFFCSDIGTDVLFSFFQVLHRLGPTIILTRTMIAAIEKWMLMICAILKTNVLRFRHVQLPMSDHMPDF